MKDKTQKIDCDFIFLIPGRNFSQEFIVSWTNTITYLYEKQHTFMFAFSYSPIVSQTRNNLLNHNFNHNEIRNIKINTLDIFQNSATCKRVIFIDSDMVWDRVALEKLLHSPHKIIMAPYVLSNKIESSVKKGNNFLSLEEVASITEPTQCDSGGLGFAACDFDVLQNINYPWFDVKQEIFGEHGTVVGEDVYFFNKIKEKGYDIYFDPSIKVGHQKSEIWMIN